MSDSRGDVSRRPNMRSHDLQGREYARLGNLKPGDRVIVDDGFNPEDTECALEPFTTHEVFAERRSLLGWLLGKPRELYIKCGAGHHGLDGQLDDIEESEDYLIGIYHGKG